MAFANRERDFFAGDDAASLFRSDQSLGRWWSELIDALVTGKKRLRLTTLNNGEIDLKKRNQWSRFIDDYLEGSSNETARAHSERLVETLGIPFESLICFLDDIAVSSNEEQVFDARKGSELAELTGLYHTEDKYGRWADWIAFYGGRIPSAPLSNGSSSALMLSLMPSVDPGIMDETTGGIFGRDRNEVEAQVDFEPTREARELFREHTGTGLWEALDLDSISSIDWSNSERVERILDFVSPVHPEKLDDGTYADRNQPFLEVYLDTETGLLEQHDLSLRARIRPEQERGLIQMKLEREPNPTTGHPVREKWERRLRGPTFLGDIPADLYQMIKFAQFGHGFGAGMPEIKKLFEILKSKDAISDSQPLLLRPDHIIFQRRRRGRLSLDSLEALTQRVTALREWASVPDAHPNIRRVLSHIEKQHELYSAAAEAIKSYTPKSELGGEAIILSADRWSVFEPGAWKQGDFPNRLSGAGRRGRGLRFETELDASTSEVFAEALEIINKRREDGDDSEILDTHQAAIEAWRDSLWADVSKARQLMSDKLESIGLNPLVNPPPSKSLQASAMIANGQEGYRRGHRFWV
jgi:hypothetical protein